MTAWSCSSGFRCRLVDWCFRRNSSILSANHASTEITLLSSARVYIKKYVLIPQASSELSGNLEAVEALLEHPVFDMKVPNKVYSVLGGFGRSCLNFHAIDGSGYKFLADNLLKVDKINAQVAARMASPFTKWRQVGGEERNQGCTPRVDRLGDGCMYLCMCVM